ncbi:MAG TPA: OmpH family outer membrane protein [Sunxiuqinia sp.]|nr:OmpH family outer membrane protein [Sunxiuqinia sp.]
MNLNRNAMKKISLIVVLLVAVGATTMAQKYAYIDTEYILQNIPAYNAAQEQLDQISSQYQKELETMHNELDKMYKDYQAESVLLSDDMKRKREDVIVTKEKNYKALQRKYFGPKGDLYKKRESLIKPIQDDIFNAVQDIANEGSYAVIFDKAGSLTMLYTNPKYDLSDQVLEKLGYKN